MGRPLGSKNKPRSESQDTHKPKKRVNPIPVDRKEEAESTAPFVEDLNERDRFIYVPDTRAVRPLIALRPSDTTPQPLRYTIVDRIENPNEFPQYILREHDAANFSQRESLVSFQSQTTPSHTSDLKQTPPRNRSTGSRSSASPHISLSVPDYDPDDPLLLRISLLSIERYVSPLEVETYENQRFANPKPEDDSFANRQRDTSSQGSNSSSKRSARPPQEEVREKKPVGRPSKKRRLMESVVINNAMGINSIGGSSTSGSEQSDGLAISGSPAARDMDGDVDMLDSIEQADFDSISESAVENALRRFRADSQPWRSPRSNSSRLNMTHPPHPKSPAQRQKKSDFAESPSPSRNTRSRASSHASAQNSIQASRSQSVNPLDHVALKTRLQPSPPTPSQRVQAPMLGKLQTLRPEKATADSAKQLIREQSGGQAPRSRLQPESPKRGSKPTSSLNEQAFERASISKPPQTFKQSKLSFRKATPKAKLPQKPKSLARKSKTPDLPLPAEEEEELEAEEPEYEVSRILSHHDNEHGRYYRVVWKGFSEEESTYLTEAELVGARNLLKKYKKKLRKVEKGGGGEEG